MKIQDRIKELRRVPATDLIRNPRNWRRHPPSQSMALRGVLEEVGYASAVIAYEGPDGLVLIDGHLRVETTPDLEVPVLITDLSEEEADKLLATLDPIGAMAQTDREALQNLVDSADIENTSLRDMLRNMGEGAQVPHIITQQYNSEFSGQSQEAIDAMRQQMEEAFERHSRQTNEGYIEMTCPHCGGDYSINRKELLDQEKLKRTAILPESEV